MKSRAKLLVANRGEIACRIFQACRELGISTAALLAPGDEEARHITYAEEVLKVPSYLDITAITQAAKQAEVTLLHPGYGFLSERPEFVRAIESAGICFLGPSPETMELLGGKTAAKAFAEKHQVPTLPWARAKKGEDLKKIASEIGFPILLKASSGGGGKGMRKIRDSSELTSAIESASAEAFAAFGEGSVFLERLVERPRHIEIQVFGDGQGGAIHLHERECSLQRRHQKIWEESPAPNLPSQTLAGLRESALKLAQATHYRSAGTVEFLVDEKGQYYFLEMNTRLQVEHPVTEFITGLDLVKMQIELAMEGFALPPSPPSRGHAIEVRLYAEDPARDFIPTPGKILKLKWPTGPGIRVDSGIEEGQTIHTQYDSMLAKLIVFGQDRPHALARLRYALEETVALGLGTNQAYLRALCDEPAVKSGAVDTGYLEREFRTFKPLADVLELELLSTALAQGLGRGSIHSQGARQEHPSPWYSRSER